MTLVTNLLTEIDAALKSNAVELVATGISGADTWANHVFGNDGNHYIGGQNRGRCPFITYMRNDQIYSFDSVGAGRGGEVTNQFKIKIVSHRKTNETLTEQYLQSVAEKVIKTIRSYSDFNLGSETIDKMESHPFGNSLMINLSVNNTWSNDIQ
jgi:hypothetical protein